MTLYTIEPAPPLRVEEPSATYSISAIAHSEIAQAQLQELNNRLAHHRANPNERRYTLDEVEAYSAA
jgi:hypothetical protein